MKHLSTSLKAIVVASLACAAGLVAAGGTTTLAVTANVSGVCKFSAASTPLSFGTIDPSGTTDATVSASVVYRCTKDTPSTGITASGGTSRTMTGAGNLPYTLAITGGTGTGTGFGTGGSDLTATVTGTIAATDYQTAAAGSYSESVTLNIAP